LTSNNQPEVQQPWSRRRAGVLLHPTSLPGPGRFGVLGSDARRFVDLIADAGFTAWQMLPVGPVDATRSPYLMKSVNAGNPELIDAVHAYFPKKTEFRAFYDANHAWATAYALFMALRERFDDAPWWEWPEGLRDHDPHDLAAALDELKEPMRQVIAGQIIFDRQWRELQDHAHARGVLIIGDLPFYVDHDSVETWWHRKLFKLNDSGQPDVVAGVPPDYFSEDGQRWGNPVYDWAGMQADGFQWWCERIAHQLHRFDAIRIDHFRALEACWEIPAESETARDGHWEPVPGTDLLTALRAQFPQLPLFAEDLGTITLEVRALRDDFDLPGMLVLQFAFDGMRDNPYRPENHVEHAVVYTGTHDNDTTVGWYESLDEGMRDNVRASLGADSPMPDALISAALASPAQLAVVPMQDLLGLGADSRMNIPGTAEGNWRWRFDWDDVPADFAARWRDAITKHER